MAILGETATRGMRLVAHCRLGLGVLRRPLGEDERVREHLTAATAVFREMDASVWLEKGEAKLRASAETQGPTAPPCHE